MATEPVAEMFPDAYVAPFVLAPEVEELAGQVIDSCDEFRPITAAIDEAGLSIVYVFETKPFDPAKEELKPHTIAKVSKAAPLWKALTGHDLALQFRRAFWDAFSDQQRQAALHHELTHVDVELDNQGRVSFSLRPHDVEDFNATIRRFGATLPGRGAFLKAFLDWQHEQVRPEPTPLIDVKSPEFLEAMKKASPEGWDVTQDGDGTIHVDVDLDHEQRE